MAPSRILLLTLAGAVVALCAGCGSGIVGSVLASNKNRQPPVPGVRILQDGPAGLSSTGPLVPDTSGLILRTLVIDNYQPPSTAQIRVVLRVPQLNAEEEQVSPVIRFRNETSTTISFFYNTSAILAGVRDPSAADLDAEIVVLVDGKQVAKPTPFKLLRQLRVELATGNTSSLLSPRGTSQLRLRVRGLNGLSNGELASSLVMRFAVVDPRSNEPGSVRILTGTSLTVAEDTTDPRARLVAAVAPALSFPAQAFVVLVSSVHGVSTIEDRVFYRPELGPLVPAAGSADGGTKVTLTGSALVPFKLDSPGQVGFDFAAVQLTVRKGGRETIVPQQSIDEDRSNESRIVFAMPPSPDGRSGGSQILLKARISSGAVLDAEPLARFAFGDTELCFGPRGGCFRSAPITVGFGRFEDPAIRVADLVSLYSEAGLPTVQLHAALGNGMFSRLGARFSGGDLNDPGQSNPSDFCVGDFDRDGLDDLVVLNRGAATVARHTMLLGQAFPLPQLKASNATVTDVPLAGRLRCADLTDDGRLDFVTMPLDARAPVVYAGDKAGLPGRPIFARSVLAGLGTDVPFEEILVTDLNGDDFQDLVLAKGHIITGEPPAETTAMRLVTMLGSKTGTFAVSQDLVLRVPGYDVTTASKVVGLHLVGDPRLSGRDLAIVLSGEAQRIRTPPAVAVLRKGAEGRFTATIATADVVSVAVSVRTLSFSASGDLDGDQIDELVVAGTGETGPPLVLMRWGGDALSVVPNAVDVGAEAISNIRGLRIGTAVAAGTFHSDRARPALFVTHDYDLEGLREYRVSTFFGAAGPRLWPADASRQFDQEIRKVVTGQFALKPLLPRGAALDAYVASDDALHLVVNDGIGNLVGDVRVAVPGLVPQTLVTVDQVVRPGFGAQTVAFLAFDTTNGCRFGIVDPKAVNGSGGGVLLDGTDLREFAPAPLRSRTVHSSSRIVSGDVDGDAVNDLVVLLVLREGQGSEGEALILFLRGNNRPSSGALPFDVPAISGQQMPALTHGNASSLALGNFAIDNRPLELAVAVPSGGGAGGGLGNHIRFYRFNTALASPGFVSSFEDPNKQVLFAGTGPTQLVAADFDSNGVPDLAVATSGDSTLRLLLNLRRPGSAGFEVDVGRFAEATARPLAIAPGTPTGLIAEDLNGDGQIDLIVPVESTESQRSSSVTYYLNPGFVDGVSSVVLPPVRTGDRIRTVSGFVARNASLSLDVSDLNGDGRFDLLFGWGSAGDSDRNLRVMFGNTR